MQRQRRPFPVLDVNAGLFREGVRESAVQTASRLGHGKQRPWDACSAQRIEPSIGETRGVTSHRVSLYHYARHTCLAEEVGGGYPDDTPSDNHDIAASVGQRTVSSLHLAEILFPPAW